MRSAWIAKSPSSKLGINSLPIRVVKSPLRITSTLAVVITNTRLCMARFRMGAYPFLAHFMRIFSFSESLPEKENILMKWAKKGYAPILNLAMHNRVFVITTASVLVILSGLLTTRMGSEFIPSLDEGDLAIHALRIPGTSLSQAVEMQHVLEKKIKEFSEVDNVFSKIGTAEIATDPMPPSVADTFVILKPRSRWPNPHRPKADLVHELEENLKKIPGNNYEFTQPIQMRFNELISGVRSDLAVKIFGDNMEVLHETGGKISKILEKIQGASDVKVEQVTALPVLTIQMNRKEMARYGLNVTCSTLTSD